MGIAEQVMLDKEYNDDLIEFLKGLLENNELTGSAQGISKLVIDKGVDSVSKKQKYVIDSIIDTYRDKYACETCSNGNIARLTDHLFIAEYGLCPMCDNDREKFMED
ncbi:hypothetical protein ACFQ0R_01675 [Psychroflexus salinarum]|uniref:Uncharacterized protein n=1 Tax=Psychroflexus salinarum TaxID=546024 RepID=A0ABW3GL08_9FLAO